MAPPGAVGATASIRNGPRTSVQSLRFVTPSGCEKWSRPPPAPENGQSSQLPSTSEVHHAERDDYLRVLISDMTSAREERFDLNSPRTALVIARLPGFLIPRIVMQVCVASSTTTTPLAFSSAARRSAI